MCLCGIRTMLGKLFICYIRISIEACVRYRVQILIEGWVGRSIAV